MENVKDMISVLKHFENGGEIEFDYKSSPEGFQDCINPEWNFDLYNYRIKQYSYPLYCSYIADNYDSKIPFIVKFDSLESGEVISIEEDDKDWQINEYYNDWEYHTNTKVWKPLTEKEAELLEVEFPVYIKNSITHKIVKFNSLNEIGSFIINGVESDEKTDFTYVEFVINIVPYWNFKTLKDYVEKELKLEMEKWLVQFGNCKIIVETDNIDEYIKTFEKIVDIAKIKLVK